MKTLIALVVSCTTMLSVYAQGNYNTVTINYRGQNRQVLVDGRTFTPVENTNYDANATSGTRAYNFSIVTNELAPGTHKLSILRQNNRRSSEATFTLRANYDLTINVDGNGSLQQTETFRRLGSGSTGTSAMSNARFNALVAELNRNRNATTRYNMIQAEFANTSNYFTTAQAKRLIQLINGEPFRLQLAKSSVRSITDTRNIYGLSSVLNSQAGRNELSEYIRTNVSTGSTGTGGTVGTGNTTTAMSTTTFNALLEDVRNRWQSGARYTALQNAFSTSSNYYFSTGQAAQLIQLLSSENERLQLLKDSYKKIVDPANFTQTYTLLSSQASRDELSYYVRMNGTTGTNTGSTVGTPMSDAAYNSIYESIRSAWGTGVRKREILNVFANTNNYFSTYQAAQLVQLESSEADRLDLAKASLRSITDRGNITLLYNALATQAARNELASYINTYGFNSNTTGTSTTYMTPMSDANFNTLLEDTRRLWIPGAKKATVLQAFSSANNYFTTAQAIQLIQLDNDEPDRLAMAKASYKVLVDKQNFSRVYDLFTTQSYRNELAAYIATIQ